MIGVRINTRALIDARKKKGWTQRQAADTIGCSRFSLIKYEDGRSQPTEEMIRKIADAYGVSFGVLTTPDAYNLYADLSDILDKLEGDDVAMIDDRVLDEEGQDRVRVIIDLLLDYLARHYNELEA